MVIKRTIFLNGVILCTTLLIAAGCRSYKDSAITDKRSVERDTTTVHDTLTDYRQVWITIDSTKPKIKQIMIESKCYSIRARQRTDAKTAAVYDSTVSINNMTHHDLYKDLKVIKNENKKLAKEAKKNELVTAKKIFIVLFVGLLIVLLFYPSQRAY